MKSIKTFFPLAHAPAAPPAPPPEAPAQAGEEQDEQGFVDFFRSKCKHPVKGNGLVYSRKVAVFGRRHVHGADVTHSIADVPASFVNWSKKNKYSYNSITCNLYEDEKSSIAWHCDAPCALSSSEIVSLSFALNRKHRNSRLANMEFRWKHAAYPNGRKTRTETLFHGTAVRWDARKHKKLRCEHRVAKTQRPRLNVTLRLLK